MTADNPGDTTNQAQPLQDFTYFVRGLTSSEEVARHATKETLAQLEIKGARKLVRRFEQHLRDEQAKKVKKEFSHNYNPRKPLHNSITFQQKLQELDPLDFLAELGITEGQAVDYLLEALQTKSSAVRIIAIKALDYIQAMRTFEPLLELFLDETEEKSLRFEAAETLGKLGDKRAVEPFLQIAQDQDNKARVAAISALGHLGDKRAVELLIATLKENDVAIRATTIEALGQLGDKRAVEPVIQILKEEALKDGDQGRIIPDDLLEKVKASAVRQAAIEALGKFGDKRATHIITYFLNDPEVLVRWDAFNALGKLNDSAAISALIAVIENGDTLLTADALNVLVILGEEAVKPLVKTFEASILKHSSTSAQISLALRQLGEITVEPLIELLYKEHQQVQGRVIILLEEIGGEKVLNALNQIKQQHSEEWMRNRAAIAIERLSKQ
jgi:HEAT repeat protein